MQHKITSTKRVKVRVTALQTDIKWAQRKANQEVAESMIASCPQSDLYVLPEMWATGFTMKPQEHAEDLLQAGNSLEWMQQMSQHFNCAICGSLAISDNGKFFNRLYFVTPTDSITAYDKHHLFAYGHENIYYQAGSKRIIATWKGMHFLLATCYDLRFPVWLRNKRNDYDAIIVVANWPRSRQNAWQILLRARAIENQCYIIGVNRVGTDLFCTYAGGTAIIDAKGHTIAQALFNTPDAISANIKKEELIQFRNKFPVWADSDEFCWQRSMPPTKEQN